MVAEARNLPHTTTKISISGIQDVSCHNLTLGTHEFASLVGHIFSKAAVSDRTPYSKKSGDRSESLKNPQQRDAVEAAAADSIGHLGHSVYGPTGPSFCIIKDIYAAIAGQLVVTAATLKGPKALRRSGHIHATVEMVGGLKEKERDFLSTRQPVAFLGNTCNIARIYVCI